MAALLRARARIAAAAAAAAAAGGGATAEGFEAAEDEVAGRKKRGAIGGGDLEREIAVEGEKIEEDEKGEEWRKKGPEDEKKWRECGKCQRRGVEESEK